MYFFLYKWQQFCLWKQLGWRISFRECLCRGTTYKDNANWKRGSGDGQTVGLWHNCAIFQCRFSFVRRRWEARFDAHLNRLLGHLRQPIAKSGKFVRREYSWTALDCEKTAVLCFCLRVGWGKREKFDVAARSEPPKPSCQSHKQRQLWPCGGPSKRAQTWTKDQKGT